MVFSGTMVLARVVGGPLAKAAIGHVGQQILGTPAERALEKVCQAAAERSAELLLPADVSDIEFSHAVDLTQAVLNGKEGELIAEAITGAAFGKSPVNGEAVELWKAAINRQGFDAATFPIPIESLVRTLAVLLPEELLKEAGTAGSPLFNAVTQAQLVDVRAVLDQHRTLLANLIPLSGAVLAALDRAVARCARNRVAFFTPHLLLALLDLSGSAVVATFDDVSPGLATELRRRLKAYVESAAAASQPFTPFEWSEREYVRRARCIAWGRGDPAVTELHLLLGVFDAPSTTGRELTTLLGSRLGAVRRVAIRTLDEREQARTPGPVLDTLDGI